MGANIDREEKQRSDLVNQDPQRCLEILVAILTSTHFPGTLTLYSNKDRQDVEYEISDLIGRCARLEPELFINTVTPFLENPTLRPVVIDAIVNSYLPQTIDLLSPLLNKIDDLSDDEACMMVCGIAASPEKLTERALEILHRLRASTPIERTEVHHEINQYLPPPDEN